MTSSDLQTAKSGFLRRYPAYEETAALDQLRQTDYSRLDQAREVYLDYTGGSLYAESQLRSHTEFLARGIFGNPHSANRASSAMTEHVESARRYLLRYCRADPDEYLAAFTLNASGALKLVGEAFPFGPEARLLLSFDNHNSVNGIREFARNKGGRFDYAPLTAPDLRLDEEKLAELLREPGPAGLFAFPAQSNFSGVKHPLRLVGEAQARGWRVLLDAAAFAPTNRLDLSEVKPDFVTLSFYKMFGYPTGIGALLIRRDAFAALMRPWFAGGTVNFVSVQARSHVMVSNEGALEDGTVNYLAIPAVETGLRHLDAIGVEKIGLRTTCLTGWLLEQLAELRHSNGKALVQVYGPADTESRGATITMNFYDPDGRFTDYRRVEELANEAGISIRTGCFCNPGAGEVAEGLTLQDMNAAFALGNELSLPRFLRLMEEAGSGKSIGALRVSFGIASNFEDAWRFVEFAKTLRDKSHSNLGDLVAEDDSCRVIRDGA